MTHIRHFFLDLRFELFAVTGGLYIFTALYYTRQLPLQILSCFILIAVTSYWSYAIRHGMAMSRNDFKLTTHRLRMNALVAVGLAIFGWFYFSLYAYLTRGHWLHLSYGGSFPVVLTIITVSSTEEIFFRGYLQNRLNYRYSMWKRVLIAVAAMAFYKNVVHMWEGMSLVLHVELLLVGILHNVLPSLWMEWSGSLVGPWLLHVVWDLLVYSPMSTIPYWVI